MPRVHVTLRETCTLIRFLMFWRVGDQRAVAARIVVQETSEQLRIDEAST